MLYQITCTCGKVFQKSDEDLKKPVVCPACNKPLSVVIPTIEAAPPVAAAAAPVAATADAEPTKRCPFCGEVILAVARKCKHCGEFLDRSPIAGGTPSGAAPAAPAPGSPAADDAVFSLTISQWNNFWRYLIIVTAVLVISGLSFIGGPGVAAVVIPGALVLGGFIAWFFYLYARNTKIFVRPLRIDIERGILSRKIETLELFRINDTELKQGMVERLLGIGTINLMTTDTTEEPEMTLYEIPRAREVHKYLQTQIPLAARQRGAVYLER